MIELSTEGSAVLLPVKVVPGASRTQIGGEWAGRLKVAVAAAPEKGKANRAVCEALAKWLGIRSRQVRVVTGETSPVKTIRIEDVSAAVVRQALDRARS